MKMKKKNFKLRVKNLIEKYRTTNPYEICKILKIDVIFYDLGNIKGYFKVSLKNKYIVINENMDEYSQKVVLCHELCHALYHSSKKILFLKQNFLNYTPEIEKEANEFAAELMKYQNEISYDTAKNCDLGLSVLEDIKQYNY